MFARWFESKNWGDAVNPILIEYLSGKCPIRLPQSRFTLKNTIFKKPVYLVVGSILSWADKDTIVWGSGFISADKKLKEEPMKICAIRGPLSRKIILEQGFYAPEIYGDSALIFPRFYKPNVDKKYRLGIVPHYTDWGDSLLKKFEEYSNILVIDITGGIYKVARDILSCEKIASSSLHGIILADAYGIPSTWIKISERVLGEGFKFRDYFMSVGRKDKDPLVITNETTVEDINKNFYNYKIDIDLDKLLASCPFKKINQS